MSDIELMRFADGERDDLELDADGKAKVDTLGEMHELLNAHLEQASDKVPDAKFAAMWRSIDKSIEDQPRSFLAKIGAWIDRHRGHVITGMASAGAVAAIALVIRTRGEDTTQSSQAIEVLPAALRAEPVVESLDTPDGTGTVMNFEDEDGHTTVIWVTPADTVEGI